MPSDPILKGSDSILKAYRKDLKYNWKKPYMIKFMIINFMIILGQKKTPQKGDLF